MILYPTTPLNQFNIALSSLSRLLQLVALARLLQLVALARFLRLLDLSCMGCGDLRPAGEPVGTKIKVASYKGNNLLSHNYGNVRA